MGILATLDRGLGIEPVERQVGEITPLLWNYNRTMMPHSTRARDLPQAYRVHPWVYAAVRVIAQAMADVPIVAVRTGRPHKYVSLAEFKRIHGVAWQDTLGAYKAQEGAEIIANHEILTLLDNPLPEANLTRHELIQSVATYLELAGNAYIEKVFSDKKKSRVVGLWPKIDPRYMWVIPGEDRLIAGYLYRRYGADKVFSADEIIHFMYFHPESPYYGLAPTEVLKQSLIADLRAIDWNRMFFEHDATPAGLLSSDQQLTRDQAALARQMWEEQHRGVSRAHRIHVLGGGWKYQPLAPTHKDMAFMDLRRWTREEILATYGVPPVMVGLREGINRATAQVERRDFYENTILPRLGKVEAVLNYSLVPKGAGIRLFFDISAIQALQEDVERKARVGRLLKDQGYTINEMRAYHGLSPAKGSMVDSILVPINMQVAGEASQKSLSSEVTKDPQVTGTPEKYLPPVDLGPQTQVHKKHLPAIALAGAARGVSVLESVGMDIPADWAERYNFQDAISQWIDEHLADTVKEIDGVTRKRAAAVIRNGIDEGKGAKAIARDLRKEFKDMSDTRALTIARTEGGKAVSFGQHKLYSNTGIKKHEWHATMKGTRQAHVDAYMTYGPGNGIPINEPFDVGGEYLIAPRMGSAPENNINCFVDPQVLIFTDSGWKQVGKIKAGDRVLTHRGQFKEVLRTFKQPGYKGNVVRIKTRNGLRLTVTEEHPLLIGDEWVLAKDIKKGDKVKVLATDLTRLNHAGAYEFTEDEIVSVSIKRLRKARTRYNFAVEDDESYVAKGIVCHNCYCEEIPVADGYRAFNPEKIKGYEAWLKEVEDKGEIHKYRQAISAFFKREGERYAKHLLAVWSGEA